MRTKTRQSILRNTNSELTPYTLSEQRKWNWKLIIRITKYSPCIYYIKLQHFFCFFLSFKDASNVPSLWLLSTGCESFEIVFSSSLPFCLVSGSACVLFTLCGKMVSSVMSALESWHVLFSSLLFSLISTAELNRVEEQ
jgi:hypothetical protein